MLIPQGIIPAMVTPFTANDEIDEKGLRALVQRFLNAKVHGLFCLGSNGEFFSLSAEEKVRIAEIIVDETKGEVPVYAGSGGISTREVIQLTRQMASIGVSAVSVITPYFLKLTDKELLFHYEEIAASTDLPIVLYNIPGLTGNSLSPKVVKSLAKKTNIVGIKDSSGSYDTILQFLEASDVNFSVLAGTDSLILPTLMAGGQGAIAATANFMPEVIVAIYERWKSGDLLGAEEEQRKLQALRNAFKLGTLPSVIKESLNMIGIPVGSPRLPVASLGGEAKEELLKVVSHYRDLGIIKGVDN